jgi:hypothetical protein
METGWLGVSVECWTVGGEGGGRGTRIRCLCELERTSWTPPSPPPPHGPTPAHILLYEPSACSPARVLFTSLY